MFVQIGQRYENGRIAKADNYPVWAFVNLISKKPDVELNWVDGLRMLLSKRYRRMAMEQLRQEYLHIHTQAIKELVEADDFGSKKS
jgi:hypothetical protein